ncbi:hypothetical protein BJ546DRAFT_23280 [Cryomyces antarcticus]
MWMRIANGSQFLRLSPLQATQPARLSSPIITHGGSRNGSKKKLHRSETTATRYAHTCCCAVRARSGSSVRNSRTLQVVEVDACFHPSTTRQCNSMISRIIIRQTCREMTVIREILGKSFAAPCPPKLVSRHKQHNMLPPPDKVCWINLGYPQHTNYGTLHSRSSVRHHLVFATRHHPLQRRQFPRLSRRLQQPSRRWPIVRRWRCAYWSRDWRP